MAILGEAIVAPREIMKYFGTGLFTARECDLAYNATQMALQWDALATGDTRVMLAAQHEISQKPYAQHGSATPAAMTTSVLVMKTTSSSTRASIRFNIGNSCKITTRGAIRDRLQRERSSR